jgi:hypothetical protein
MLLDALSAGAIAALSASAVSFDDLVSDGE